MSQYLSATKSTIAKLPLYRANAIFYGLPAERKVEIWLEKVRSYAESHIDSSEEKTCYLSITKYLTDYYFATEEGTNEFRKIAREWAEILKEKYGWTDEDIFFSSYIWMTEEEYLESMLYQKTIMAAVDSTEVSPPDTLVSVNCDCSVSLGCTSNIDGDYCDKKYGCNKIYDCGLFRRDLCTGKCN